MRSQPPEIVHIPVLLQEVLGLLRPKPGGRYLDATLGLGGHAEGILEGSAPDGFLYGLDWDGEALDRAALRLQRFAGRVRLLYGDFKELEEMAHQAGISDLDGLLFDLGLSSLHLESSERGFAFSQDGPLDMRMDRRKNLRAADLVNRLSEGDLADLIWRFGEERWAKRIARRVVEFRRTKEIEGTRELAEIVRRAMPPKSRGFRIHPATRTFQALRIAVNRELEGLDEAIRAGVGLLRPGGRVVVLSYHSLEDRMVKRTLGALSRGCHCPPQTPVCCCEGSPRVKLLVAKPMTAGEGEVEENPRSRSAKLRAAERL